MTAPTVKAAARALYEHYRADWTKPWEELPLGVRQAHLKVARIALRAAEEVRNG